MGYINITIGVSRMFIEVLTVVVGKFTSSVYKEGKLYYIGDIRSLMVDSGTFQKDYIKITLQITCEVHEGICLLIDNFIQSKLMANYFSNSS